MDSDDDIEDAVGEEQVKVDEVEEDEIVESDVELEGETVDPDDDPPQKVSIFFKKKINCGRFLLHLRFSLRRMYVSFQMGDPSIEVTDESRESSQSAKAKAMEAISEGNIQCKVNNANAYM